MGRADFLRAEYSRRNSVAHLLQVSGDFIKTESDVTGNVLEENKSWLDFSDDSGNFRPEMTGISGTEPLPGLAEGRARVARNDAIHDSAPRAAIEGSKIRPNSRVIQGFLFHARIQDAADVTFPLNAADDASRRDRHSDADVEHPGSGAEGQDVKGIRAHIHSTFALWFLCEFNNLLAQASDRDFAILEFLLDADRPAPQLSRRQES